MGQTTIVFEDGSKLKTREDGSFECWSKDGRLHSSDDRPSIFIPESAYPGHLAYHKDGELHRENGPALIYTDGREYYFLLGDHYPKWYWNVARKIAFLRYLMKFGLYIYSKTYDIFHEVFIGPKG
jgi:hypothetical protein